MVLKTKNPLKTTYSAAYFFSRFVACNKEPWLKNEIQKFKKEYQKSLVTAINI